MRFCVQCAGDKIDKGIGQPQSDNVNKKYANNIAMAAGKKLITSDNANKSNNDCATIDSREQGLETPVLLYYYLSHDDVIDQRHRPGGKSCTNPAVRAGKVTSTPNTSIYAISISYANNNFQRSPNMCTCADESTCQTQ